ncbi:MAG TPA: histidinol-phosphatase [Acidimicrobiales bacterium]|nr:histidinol-phosphatase [Acidimicrobiales bacterium]
MGHPDLELALALADSADAITQRWFRDADLGVETKADMTPVSIADRAVEEMVRATIAEARPSHSVLGEEYGDDGAAAWRWIVDPIDGTKNFVRGIPVFATLLALEHEGSLELGVVSAPALGRRWWGTRDGGAFADGVPVRVSAVARIEDAHLSGDGYDAFASHGRGDEFATLATRCVRSRGFGDFWSHMLVAEGAIDIAVEPEVSYWDLAAIAVIVEAAGGRFTNLAGEARADGGSAVSTNGLLHDEVLAALNSE